ncbi:hypothetical protein JCM1841_004907 [Sporobolomyces salmonicolor]
MTIGSYLAPRIGFSNGKVWEPSKEIPDLTGKVAVVTGGNVGLGFVTAQELAAKGCKVYIACRNEERAKAAIEKINAATPGKEADLVYLPFDLTDLQSAKAAAQTLEEQGRLDIVVNNAGVMAWPYKLVNGVEIQFWNHLGHFALIHHLLPLLVRTSKESSVRIVNVSSLGHTFSPQPDFSSMNGANGEFGSTWRRYGQAKLANILFSVGLQERVKGENIRVRSLPRYTPCTTLIRNTQVNSCHPGNVNTELTRGPAETYGFVGRIMSKLGAYITMSPTEGAKTQLFLAASPEVDEKDYRAKYFTPIATETEPSAMAQDKELAEQLWKLSEDWVKRADA